MTHFRIEFRVARLVFQDIARSTLIPQENVFLLALVSQAKQKFYGPTVKRANFGKDVPDDLRRLFHFTSLQKNNIDPRLFDPCGGLEDLCLAQFEDRVPARIVATHWAEFTIDPAKVRHFH